MDDMVSSTCSSASIESAPAGFPGAVAVNAAEFAANAADKSVFIRRRPVSISEAEFLLKGTLRNSISAISTQQTSKNRNSNLKRTTSSKLSSLSKRGRYDSAFRSSPDYYPFPRWRPLRMRKYSAVGADGDLKQLNNIFKEFEWNNRKKSVIRFFDCR